jgi:hypothetical protein
MWLDAPYIDASIPFEIMIIDEMTNSDHSPLSLKCLLCYNQRHISLTAGTLLYSIHDSTGEGRRKMIESSKRMIGE